ncbi:MAG: hypothetical protein U9N04_04835 [Patescibacteria group bacterium]|nr:hypothetical protein [Patescibacteria group bacterium]
MKKIFSIFSVMLVSVFIFSMMTSSVLAGDHWNEHHDGEEGAGETNQNEVREHWE